MLQAKKEEMYDTAQSKVFRKMLYLKKNVEHKEKINLDVWQMFSIINDEFA